jgi:monoamine oxidase
MNTSLLEPGKTYTFKLNSGEELVAKVVETSKDTFAIENPVSIAPGPQGMGLVPSLFTADLSTSIQLNINSVALIAQTEDSVAMKYLEAITGIKVPEKKIIMG